MEVRPHRVYAEDESGRPLLNTIAIVHSASPKAVRIVLDADPDDRSQWVWVNLANGDVVLGVYPQGPTYEQIERDAQPPSDL